ncbi:MAG TPA: presqualene diphosphate synthase HpnD [Verrucomicrobiae bacterium]|nr:presqualene diphosphate synthase HpnD [Verrucomicrobiae bacterium]
MSVSLEESYALCGRIARKTGRNFYYSFLVMPREKRAAMCAIYAFMRRSDDIADGAGNPAVALEGLRQWRGQVDAALNGDAAGDPILPALVDTVRRYRIPPRYFHELLDGTEMDQTTTRYTTFDDLYKYCYRVASAVGLVVLPVFGFKDEAALVPAEACGIAFQLTNILRDVKEDAQMGRVYLPLEDLRRFGVSENDIMDSRATPQFLELMKFETARAHEFYEKARPLLDMIDADSRGTLAVMMTIYGGILRKIEESGFAVFDGRIRLSTAEKLWIVGKNWMGHRE